MRRIPLFLSVLILIASPARGQSALAVPAWVKEGRPIKPADIPAGDFAYISSWIAGNATPADEYFIEKAKRYDVVVFGEGHNVREHKEFIINLIPRLYREAGVRCIGWEFSSPAEDVDLERLISMPHADPEAVLNFGRRHMGSWNSTEHWAMIEAVRALNAGLPNGAPKMRFVGLDIPVDWHDLYTKIKTVAKDSPEGQEVQRWFETRDPIMAENAERATLAAGAKAVLFVGSGHDQTHLGAPPDEPYRRPIMAKVLHDKYPGRVFQVAGDAGWYPVAQRAMEALGHKVSGFDLYASPLASVLSADMGTPERTLGSLARGYVYFGSCQQLHGNTPIRGFVTDEMYAKYRTYFDVDFGQKLATAREFDEYLQRRNWKIKCPEPLR
jgi:hypothetical protein